ncbi:MAG: serine/threonine-protein kinase [Planctomycetota bacterium]
MAQHTPPDPGSNSYQTNAVSAVPQSDSSVSHGDDDHTSEPNERLVDEHATIEPADVSASASEKSNDTLGGVLPVELTRGRRSVASGLRFRVLRSHARGGLGQVLLARDDELHRDVAVKEIQPQYADLAESRQRFVFEAEVTGRLEHPGVVPIYALGQYDDGRPFYAMRFVSGTAMNDAIKDVHREAGTGWPNRQIRELLQRLVTVCNTIDYAHSRGYVHRDLKPANIMLGEYAETLVVDWGLAKQIFAPEKKDSKQKDGSRRSATAEPIVDAEHDSLATPHNGGDSTEYSVDGPSILSVDQPARSGDRTRAGRVVGTPQYMAPEQALGNVEAIGPHSDVYALGATLYHLLTGQPPLGQMRRQSMRDLLTRVAQGEIPTPREIKPAVPKPLDAICRHAMATEAQCRYPTARAMAADIENYLADDRVSVMPENSIDRLGRYSRKHRGVTATAGAALVLIAIVATSFYAVTQKALSRTERFLAISQLQQRFDTAMNNEAQRIGGSPVSIDDVVVSDRFIRDNASLIKQMETLQRTDDPSFVDSNRRFALLQAWSSSIDELSNRRMNRDRHEQLRNEVKRFANGGSFLNETLHATEVTRLTESTQRRIAEWFDVPLPEETQSISVNRANSNAPITLATAPRGNLELIASFSGDFATASTIGLTLNANDEAGYRFLIADRSYHPVYVDDALPSIAKSNDLGRLTAMIIRDQEVLRMQPITLEPGTSTARLIARREGGTLLTLIYRHHQLRFEDLFPLSTQVAGQVGVIASPGINISVLSLQSQNVSLDRVGDGDANVDAIEAGDAAFAAGDFVRARQAFERAPHSVEALAKRALVLEYLDPNQYVEALQSIIDDHAPEGVADTATRRWYLYAGVRLFLHYMNEPDEQVRANNALSRLRVNYTLEDVQSLVPESQRQQLAEALIKPGKRTRVLFDNQGELRSLEGAIELFSNNDRWRRLAYWRKADTLRYDWQREPAEARAAAAPILDELIKTSVDAPDIDELTLVTLVTDRVWVHLLDREFDAARRLLQQFLPEPGVRVTASRLPLLIDRARIEIASHDWGGDDASSLDAARHDLQTFLERVDPVRPPSGIHHSHYGNACGMMGILERRAGNPERAREIWQRGRRRHWGPYVFDTDRIVNARGPLMILETEIPEPFLAAWTDGYRGDEWREIVHELLAGSGLSDVAVRNLIFNSQQLPDEWIKLVAEKAYSGPRGRAIGEATLLHQIPLMQTSTDGVALIFYQAILHLALDGESTLKQYPGLDEALFERCRRIQVAFQERRLAWNEMAFILAAFTGSWNEESYQRLRDQLEDPDLAAGLAIVFALMQLQQHGNAEKSREIMTKFVTPQRDKLPSVLVRLCDDRMSSNAERTESEPIKDSSANKLPN